MLALLGNYADDTGTAQSAGELATHDLLEADQAILDSKEGIVLSLHDSDAGLIERAMLADDNIASVGVLVSKNLDAKPLGATIAPITCTAGRFFVCHMRS